MLQTPNQFDFKHLIRCFHHSISSTLSGASTPGHSRSGSDGNEGILRISQGSRITGASPLDCLVSYPGNSWGRSYPSAKIQLVYSTAPADWASILCILYIHHHLPKEHFQVDGKLILVLSLVWTYLFKKWVDEISKNNWESSCGEVANVQCCDIVVSKFESYSCYYVHSRVHTFEKGMNSLIPQTMGWIVFLLFIKDDSTCI